MENRLTPVELRDNLQVLLRLTTMTISTVSRDGEPHAAAVYFVCDDLLNLFFFSAAQSQHSRDMTYQPRAAVTIYAECFGWQDIHGLQLRGGITHVREESEWQPAWDIYQIKFPFVSDLRDIVARNQLHKFSPDWIRLVDNHRGFGYKQEWVADQPGGETVVWRRLAKETGLSEGGHG